MKKHVLPFLLLPLVGLLFSCAKTPSEQPSEPGQQEGGGQEGGGEEEQHIKVLRRIEIASMPNKLVYKRGDTLDLTGLKVIAHYTDSYFENADVTNQVNISPTRLDNVGDNIAITISYTEGGVTRVATFNVKVEEQEGGGDQPGEVRVTGITANPTSIELDQGQTRFLSWSVLPSNATNKNVTFSVNNNNVTVSNNGNVSANVVGTSVVTITTVDGGYTATVNVKVNAVSTNVPVTGVTANPSSISMRVGESKTLSWTVTPSDATNKSVRFSVNKTGLTVNENGLATANAAGNYIITITTVDGGYTATVSASVSSVDPTSDVVGITSTMSHINVKLNQSKQLIWTVLPENTSHTHVTFNASNDNITVDSNGIVTGKKEGESVVSITNEKGQVLKVDVTVRGEEESHEDPGLDPSIFPNINYPRIYVRKNAGYTHVYAWLNSGGTKPYGDWPGTALSTTGSYDPTNWYTVAFEGYTSMNFIFNNGSDSLKTGDLSVSKAGYYWFQNGSLYTKEPEEGAGSNQSIPQGNYHLVESAKDYTELPAVKEYAKGPVVSKYTGNRTDFRDESIYFAMTTRFYDGDSSNNMETWGNKNNPPSDPSWRGDFKGLIQKMDYIKALGFTAIWITPVVKNASDYDYHGYHAINFKEVDPRYESEDVKFIDVIKEAHKRDMKIVLDVVFNHTSNNAEENLFPMFTFDSIHSQFTINEEYDYLPQNYWNLDGGAQFQARLHAMQIDGEAKDQYNIYHHELNMGYESYIEQTGSMAGDCRDLNTENPTVANYLVEAFGEFIRMGVDAFRVDTVKHISRLTLNKYIVPGLYAIADKCGNENFHMFGEVCTRVREVWNHGIQADSCPFYSWTEDSDYEWGTREVNEASARKHWDDHTNTSGAPTSNNEYLNSGYTYHAPDHSRWSRTSVIDFPMHRNFEYASSAYGVAVGNDQFYNDATYNVVYVDSHDYGPEIGSDDTTRYPKGTNAWKENLSLMFTFRGVPCIYYGSEVEFQAGVKIDQGPNLALANSGRAYFGDRIEGSVNVTGFGQYSNATGAMANTLNYSLAKHIQKLSKIRLAVPALRRGQYADCGDGMNFVRRYTANGVDSIAVVSISGGHTFTGLPNGTYKNLAADGNVTQVVSNGVLVTDVSGQGNLAVWVRQ